jgi:four helix bundle protein
VTTRSLLYLRFVHKYQTLVAWQRAHNPTLLALRQCDSHYHPKSRALFDQLRRATVSVGANIVEGYALGTPLQFRRHLRIALGSAAEAEYLTKLIAELEYLPKTVTEPLEQMLERTMAALYGLIRKHSPTERVPRP